MFRRGILIINSKPVQIIGAAQPISDNMPVPPQPSSDDERSGEQDEDLHVTAPTDGRANTHDVNGVGQTQHEQFWAYYIIISRLSADKRLWPCILVNQFIIYKYCALHIFLACCYFMSSETLLCEMCYNVLCTYLHGWIWMFKLKLYIGLFHGTM